MSFTTLPQEEAYVFSKSGLTDLENLKKSVHEDCRTNQISFCQLYILLSPAKPIRNGVKLAGF